MHSKRLQNYFLCCIFLHKNVVNKKSILYNFKLLFVLLQDILKTLNTFESFTKIFFYFLKHLKTWVHTENNYKTLKLFEPKFIKKHICFSKNLLTQRNNIKINYNKILNHY